MHRYWSFPITGALTLSLLSCKTEEAKKAPPAPPARAMAPTLSAPPSAPPKIQEQLPPKVDPVAALVAGVEKEYQAGLANYTAGHLDAAKDNFDRAFDLLLQSDHDVRGNDRLRHEFDKLVEGVNNLEMVALKAGDGFTEQKAEPA